MALFLGSIYPQFLLDELTKRRLYADYPANVFQHSLLKGLDEFYSDLRVISSPVIRSPFSAVKDICRKGRFSHGAVHKESDVYVGTVPIPGLQMLFEFCKVYWNTKKEINKDKNKRPVVFVYALHTPFLLTAVLLKKKTVCTCVIVPDLPEYMSKRKGIITKLGKKVDRCIIDYCVKKLDCYVLLSQCMRDKLPIENKPWTLVEGLFDSTFIPQESAKCNERVILYSGNLSRQYGIIELLQAFALINKRNYRLWICGRGEGETDVIKEAQNDERIVYFGVVPHEEVLALQKKATVLINPRPSAGEFTKYSFPSKTLEYLASGTPTIMCHLPAIPSEYDEHVFYIDDESPEGIRAKILEVCEKSQEELDYFGNRAASFIIQNKSIRIQVNKIVHLVNSINK